MDSIRHAPKLRPVLRYLEHNYRQPVDLATMARMAALSPYHFHRLFKACTDETPAHYLRRLRLEDMALQLFLHRANVTTLALTYGFSSSQALSKAFKQYFGVTPSEVKQCHDTDDLAHLLQNSKIGHALRKHGHAQTATLAYGGAGASQPCVRLETEWFAQRSLAVIRVTGPYGQAYEAALTRLYQWAGAHGVAHGECVFVFRDSPDITPAAKCRTDIGLSVPTDTAIGGGLARQVLPQGSYATTRQTVTDAGQYPQYWDALIRATVEAGLTIDHHRPCFEFYHARDPSTGHADVGFYLAIRM